MMAAVELTMTYPSMRSVGGVVDDERPASAVMTDRPPLMSFPQGESVSVLSGPHHALQPPLLLHEHLDALLRLSSKNADSVLNRTALVTRTPSGASVRKFSYAQLRDLSSLIAQRFLHKLHHHHHHPKDRDDVPYIAFCARKSPELCIAMLGALRAGCAYLPIDYDWPAERFRYVLHDARPSILVIDAEVFKHQAVLDEYCNEHSSVRQIELSDELFHRLDGDQRQLAIQKVVHKVKPDQTALILYTSGTTGEPKGVKLPHRGMMNALQFRQRNFPYFPDEDGLLKTVMTFSDSALEMFETWFALRPLIVLTKDDLLDVRKFLQILESNRVYRMIVVPSLLQALLDVLQSENRRKFRGPMWMISTDGEPMTAELAERFFEAFPQTKLANFYGQTECCADLAYEIWNNLEAFNATRSADGNVSIGRLIDNLTCYIVDQNTGLPAPVGTAGELYVSGPSVCKSYIGTTLGKFLPNSFIKSNDSADETGTYGSDHTILLKTGDLAVYEPKKAVLYVLGRTDDMVKIAGQKVHLIEVQKAMQKIPGVAETAVLSIVRLGQVKLIGFLRFSTEQRHPTNNSMNPTAAALLEESRNILRRLLPAYAQPRLILHQNPFPRTEAGKISKSQLLKFYSENYEDLLQNDPKSALGILATTLGVQTDAIDMQKSFVENGGSSLILLPAVLALKNAGFNIELNDFLAAQSVQQILDACNKPKNVTEQHKNSASTAPPRCSFGVTITPLSELERDEAVDLLADSFGNYQALSMYGESTAREMRTVIEVLYPYMLAENLSFGLVRNTDARLVAVSMSLDNATELRFSRRQIGTQFNGDVHELLSSLDALLEPYLPKGRGQVWHAMMDAVLSSIGAEDKVALMYMLFEEEIKRAKQHKFRCIMAETASALTAQLAHDFTAHKTYCKIRPKEFVTSDGRMPWINYPENYYIYGDVLWLNDDDKKEDAN